MARLWWDQENEHGMARLERSELLVGVQPLYLNAKFKPNENTTTSGKDGDPSDWIPTAGNFYVHSLTPDLPMGEQWRFGLGVLYTWSENLTLGCAYELAWTGDLDMDVSKEISGKRVSGTYEDISMHFLNFTLNWRF